VDIVQRTVYSLVILFAMLLLLLIYGIHKKFSYKQYLPYGVTISIFFSFAFLVWAVEFPVWISALGGIVVGLISYVYIASLIKLRNRYSKQHSEKKDE